MRKFLESRVSGNLATVDQGRALLFRTIRGALLGR